MSAIKDYMMDICILYRDGYTVNQIAEMMNESVSGVRAAIEAFYDEEIGV